MVKLILKCCGQWGTLAPLPFQMPEQLGGGGINERLEMLFEEEESEQVVFFHC